MVEELRAALAEMTYREGLKAETFLADSPAKAAKAAEDWIADAMSQGSLHIVGAETAKAGRNIHIFVVVYSPA